MTMPCCVSGVRYRKERGVSLPYSNHESLGTCFFFHRASQGLVACVCSVISFTFPPTVPVLVVRQSDL